MRQDGADGLRRGGDGQARRKTIAKGSYKGLKPGSTKRLSIKLSKSGRKAVAKVKRGKKFKVAVTVTVRDAAGRGATAKRTVSLRR